MARAFPRDQDPLHLMRILAAGARDPERVVAEGPDVDAIIEDFGLGEDDVRFPEEIILAAEQEFPYAGARNLEALRSSEELEKSLISTWLWLTTRLRRDDPLRAWLAGRLDDFEPGFDPSPIEGSRRICAPPATAGRRIRWSPRPGLWRRWRSGSVSRRIRPVIGCSSWPSTTPPTRTSPSGTDGGRQNVKGPPFLC